MSAGNAAAFQYRDPAEERLTAQSKLSKIKTQGWRGKIIKSLVEAFGLYPKCKRFKEGVKIITFVI